MEVVSKKQTHPVRVTLAKFCSVTPVPDPGMLSAMKGQRLLQGITDFAHGSPLLANQRRRHSVALHTDGPQQLHSSEGQLCSRGRVESILA